MAHRIGTERRKVISFTLPPSIVEALQDAAQADGVSKSLMVESLIVEGLAQRKERGRPIEPNSKRQQAKKDKV